MQDFIKWGLDREVPPLLEPRFSAPRLRLNLGPGDVKIIPGTLGVGRANNKLTDREWNAPEPLPFADGSAGVVHAHHFLEHFDVDDVMTILHEIGRVLAPGGVAFITTPMQGTSIQRRALDHKTEWNEETWEWIFNTTYYDDFPPPAGLKIHTVFIAGIVERNLCVFAQLVKEG
jgi:SAM-dependent methyltransferase